MSMTAKDYLRDEWYADGLISEIQDLFNDEFLEIFNRLEKLEQKAEQNQNLDIKTINEDELTSNSKTAIAKLLYALLSEHDYKLGERKGNTNDVLVNLTKKHNVSITRETVASWLDRVNEIHRNKK